MTLDRKDFRKGRLPSRFQNALAYHHLGKKIAGYKSNLKNCSGNENEWEKRKWEWEKNCAKFPYIVNIVNILSNYMFWLYLKFVDHGRSFSYVNSLHSFYRYFLFEKSWPNGYSCELPSIRSVLDSPKGSFLTLLLP